jgi:hypothetical protein
MRGGKNTQQPLATLCSEMSDSRVVGDNAACRVNEALDLVPFQFPALIYDLQSGKFMNQAIRPNPLRSRPDKYNTHLFIANYALYEATEMTKRPFPDTLVGKGRDHNILIFAVVTMRFNGRS